MPCGLAAFDLISRPYYPPDDNPSEVEIEHNEDTRAVYQYFKFLFDEVKRQKELQFIVIDTPTWFTVMSTKMRLLVAGVMKVN